MKEDNNKEVKQEKDNQIKLFQCTYDQYKDRHQLTSKPLNSDQKAD